MTPGRRLTKVVKTLIKRAGGSTHARSGTSGPDVTRSGQVVDYAPALDGDADPGEVVWAWVPFEDDPSQGKDRPVLVVGRDAETLLALHLSSKDHDVDAADEARYGRYWMDIGSGAWDHQRRASEVRLDRLVRLEQDGVRREGAILERETFDAVLREARRYHDF